MRALTFLFFPFFVIAGCGAPAAPASAPPTAMPTRTRSSVAFDYAGPQWIRIPATVGTTATHVFFDTGGGISIFSKTLCEK